MQMKNSDSNFLLKLTMLCSFFGSYFFDVWSTNMIHFCRYVWQFMFCPCVVLAFVLTSVSCGLHKTTFSCKDNVLQVIRYWSIRMLVMMAMIAIQRTMIKAIVYSPLKIFVQFWKSKVWFCPIWKSDICNFAKAQISIFSKNWYFQNCLNLCFWKGLSRLGSLYIRQ